MATVRNQPLGSGKFQACYKDADGRRVWFAGTRNRKDTLAIARKLEDDHRQVSLGYRDPARPWERERQRPIQEAVAEYLDWGRAQGGLHGHPWDDKHAERRAYFLKFWNGALKLETLGDLAAGGLQAAVEKILRDLLKPLTQKERDAGAVAEAASGKTKNNYADGLKSFCQWLRERNLLGVNPLAGLSKFDATPRSHHRALQLNEARALLDTIEQAPAERYMRFAKKRLRGYQLALCTGLRADELRELTVAQLNATRGGLDLAKANTKDRRGGFQPLPWPLVHALVDESKEMPPKAPLVFVAREAANALEADLIRAGLTKHGPGGKADFHALRGTLATLLDQLGASERETQAILRHAPRSITFERYTQVFEERLRALVEKIGEQLLGKRVARVYAIAVGSENTPVIDADATPYDNVKKWAGRDLNPFGHPISSTPHPRAEVPQSPPTPRVLRSSAPISSTVEPSPPLPSRTPAAPELPEIRAAGVHADPALAALIQRWPALPPKLRQAIHDIVELHGGRP